MSDEAIALRLSALEQEISRLRAELGAQHRPTPTLRQQGVCPACGGRRFLHAPSVLDRADGGPSELALAKPSIWRSRVFCVFEAYACVGCGWVEWYVKDPASLEELPNKKEGFIIVDTSIAAPETPYR